MATYIFFWNPDISSVTREYFESNCFDHGAFWNWSIHEYEDVRLGDEFYMIVCGQINAVVGHGVITSTPYQGRDWSPRNRRRVYYVDLHTFDAINPFATTALLTGDVLSAAMPDFDWHGGHSGRRLPENYVQPLRHLFRQYLAQNTPQLLQDNALKTLN